MSLGEQWLGMNKLGLGANIAELIEDEICDGTIHLCPVRIMMPLMAGLPFITTFRGSLGPPHHAHRGSF